MKLSKRDVGLLLGLFGIIIAFCAYQYVYTPMVKKIETVKAETLEINGKINNLKTIQAEIEDRKKDTVEMDNEVRKILTEFPSNQLTLDGIILAYSAERSAEYLFVNGMSFSEPAVVYTTSQPAAENTGFLQPTGTVPSYALNTMQFSYNMENSYQGFKDFLNFVYNQSDRKSISTVSAAFDPETGFLNGSLTVDTYFVYGTGKEYTEPKIPYVPTGVENIFGTLDVPEGEEGAAEGETAEE